MHHSGGRSRPSLARRWSATSSRGPDIAHEYDDGGLVDVNHVPGGVLAPAWG